MNHMDEMGMDMGMPRRMTMALCDRTVSVEVSGDYTLPDYQMPIRRVLTVRPTVLPPAKYVSGTGVEFNGTVDYQVLYVGTDGGLYTVPLSSEYSFNVPLEQVGEVDLNEGVTALASTVCESLSTRVSAPRRMSIRGRLRSHVRAYGRVLMEESVSGAADPATIRRLCEETENMQISGGVSDVISLGVEIPGVGEDARVITAEAVTLMDDVRPGDGLLRAAGNVWLDLLIGRESGAVERMTRKLPLEGEIELEGLTPDSLCRATGTVSDVTVNVEDGRILCDVGVLLEGRGMQNLPLRYTADLYSTETESVCEYEDYAVPVVLRCENRNLSQSERIAPESVNLPEGAELIHVWGEARMDACEQAGDKYVLTGQSRYTLLLRKDGDYSTAEVTLPLRYETDGAGSAPSCFDATAEVISCRAQWSGETLSLDAELSIVADFVGENSIRALEEARFGEKLDCRGNRMVVYYPVPGDTPWTVAKKYHISPERLTEGAAYYLL
ncbi:MAG: DUF3794 domain-containing protein [Clostridia bacterium]|nr:DUF3794 domain-containing protein [Clostridia bacterium]